MDVTIRIEKMDELITALNNVAGIAGKLEPSAASPAALVPQSTPAQTPVQQQVPPQMPVQTPAAPVPVQQAYTAPTPQSLQLPPGVITGKIPMPTTAVPQEYTQEQVSIAMSGLMDAGKKDVVMQLLAAFGVQALVQIPKERYPELVLKLREAGANI